MFPRQTKRTETGLGEVESLIVKVGWCFTSESGRKRRDFECCGCRKAAIDLPLFERAKRH